MTIENSRRIASTACAVLLAGCSLLVNTSDLSGGASEDDGGSDAGRIADARELAAEAAAPHDAATIVDAADACTPHLSTRNPPPLVPLAAPWDLLGTATVVDGAIRLMEPVGGQAGAAWWGDAIPRFEAFDMTAGLYIDPADNPPGDGVAFTWLEGSAIPDLGENGGDMAVGGLGPGWAVTVDFINYENSDPVDGPFIGIADTSKLEPGWYVTGVPIHGSVYLAEHFFHVALAKGGVVSAWWDDELVLDHVPIPDYTPFAGHWGFGAASGGNYALARLTRVSFVDRTNDTCHRDE